MDLIRTGINLSKAIRNVGRLKEIVSVFAKNGFDEFIHMGITSAIPNFVLPKSGRKIREEIEGQAESTWGKVIGVRLRKSFEELGPTFIKLGQLLSSREDLFDENFINEMKLLRDKVKEIPFSEVKNEVENAFGKSCEQVFLSVQDRPIGTASIGVAYKAILKNGDEVVLKVRRPNIKKTVQTDFSIMLFLIAQVEKASADIKYLGVSRILKDFAITLNNELNFNVEALSCQRFKESVAKKDKDNILYIPTIFSEYTTERTLVMEFMRGIPFSDARIADHVKEIKEKLEKGVQIFLLTILQDGFFHADLHGGNFFLLESGQIGIIDYGLMGTLGRKSRQNFVAILYALITFNYENLVYEFLDVAEYEQIPDIDILISDVRDALSSYIGLTVQQTNYTEVFQAIMSTLNRHRLFLPRDWFVVFRALITIDGVGKTLNIDFDIFGIVDKDIRGIIKESFDKDVIVEEMVWASRDIIPALRILPRHLRWFIKDLSKKNYAFEVINKGYEKELTGISNSISFLALAFVASIFILGGILFAMGKDIHTLRSVPHFSWLLWGLGTLTLFRARFFIR